MFLIDPKNVINYDRTTGELETWWLFSLVVAGKTAATQARLLNAFLTSLPPADNAVNDTAFARLYKAEAQGTLYQALIDSRLGQYNRLHRAIVQSLHLDLAGCTIADLEAIHGVGPKTARMFLMMSRPNQRHAALDTHVLKFLASKGHVVPKATPPAGSTYRKWEDQFLVYADESKMSVSEFDLMIWKSYARHTV